MQDAKTGGSRWVPDIREDEITEFQEQNGDETATYKAVNVHPIISRVLDKLAFFRTHVSAVWYNKLANKTVKDKLDEIDTSINSLNSSLEKLDKGDFRHTLRFESLDALNNIQVENNAINICRANIAGSGWCTVITVNIDNVLLAQLIFSGTSVKTRNCQLSNRTWTDFSDH